VSYLHINFGPSEIVKAISGLSQYRVPYLSTLKIVTNVATYGPFGDYKGNIPFNVTVPNDQTVVGFFVCASDGVW
jgi:hypothetical protein